MTRRQRSAGGLRARHFTSVLLVGALVVIAGCMSSGSGQQNPGDSGLTDPSPTPSPKATESVATSTHPQVDNEPKDSVDPVPVADGAYGDFGDQSWTTIDFIEATRRVADCMEDHGFNVELVPPGDGISYQGIPPEQRAAAHAQDEECQRSMAIPEFSWPTSEELRVVYEYNVKLNQCLESLGFSTTPPPSFDVFEDSYQTGPWMAYFGANVGSGDIDTMRVCPQVPPGGFGAWDVDDPIQPLTDSP